MQFSYIGALAGHVKPFAREERCQFDRPIKIREEQKFRGGKMAKKKDEPRGRRSSNSGMETGKHGEPVVRRPWDIEVSSGKSVLAACAAACAAYAATGAATAAAASDFCVFCCNSQ